MSLSTLVGELWTFLMENFGPFRWRALDLFVGELWTNYNKKPYE